MIYELVVKSSLRQICSDIYLEIDVVTSELEIILSVVYSAVVLLYYEIFCVC